MIKGLHHNAYRCRDSEETRRFYEDFLGLRFAEAFRIGETKTGRGTAVLHSFYEMGDGSFLAFFEAPDRPFEFKEQHDFDLHIALEVDDDTLERMLKKGRAEGVDTRGVADHGFVRSIYFRDPNPTSPTQRAFCRFSLFSTTQVIELLSPCTPNSPQYCL